MEDLHNEVKTFIDRVFEANPILVDIYKDKKDVWDESNPTFAIASENFPRTIATVVHSQGISYVDAAYGLSNPYTVEEACKFNSGNDPEAIQKAYSMGWVFSPGNWIGYWWHPSLPNASNVHWSRVEKSLNAAHLHGDAHLKNRR